MSRPAVSCARRNTDTASSYCSRKRELTIASRKLCVPNAAVYQDGRGSEPLMEVGNTTAAEALYIGLILGGRRDLRSGSEFDRSCPDGGELERDGLARRDEQWRHHRAGNDKLAGAQPVGEMRSRGGDVAHDRNQRTGIGLEIGGRIGPLARAVDVAAAGVE